MVLCNGVAEHDNQLPYIKTKELDVIDPRPWAVVDGARAHMIVRGTLHIARRSVQGRANMPMMSFCKSLDKERSCMSVNKEDRGVVVTKFNLRL